MAVSTSSLRWDRGRVGCRRWPQALAPGWARVFFVRGPPGRRLSPRRLGARRWRAGRPRRTGLRPRRHPTRRRPARSRPARPARVLRSSSTGPAARRPRRPRPTRRAPRPQGQERLLGIAARSRSGGLVTRPDPGGGGMVRQVDPRVPGVDSRCRATSTRPACLARSPLAAITNSSPSAPRPPMINPGGVGRTGPSDRSRSGLAQCRGERCGRDRMHPTLLHLQYLGRVVGLPVHPGVTLTQNASHASTSSAKEL